MEKIKAHRVPSDIFGSRTFGSSLSGDSDGSTGRDIYRSFRFTVSDLDECQLADDGNAESLMGNLRLLYDVPHGICRSWAAEMETLPVRQESSLENFSVTALASLVILTVEMAAVYGCIGYWFAPEELKIDMFLKNLGFQFFVFLPTGDGYAGNRLSL